MACRDHKWNAPPNATVRGRLVEPGIPSVSHILTETIQEIAMRTRRHPLALTTLLLAVVVAGCASMTPAAPPLAPQWTRDALLAKSFRCRPGKCRTNIQSKGGQLDVATDAREYAPHEIPGWDGGSRAGRVASSVLARIGRRNGLTTDQTRVGLGTRVVADADGWQLRCSVLWIDDQEVEYNRTDDDHVTRDVRRTEGADCRAFAPSDSNIVRWRFRAGIAPSRDSLATIYDSLEAAKSAAVTATPPMSLEHLTAAGAVDATYCLTRDVTAPSLMQRLSGATHVHVRRETGALIGTIQSGWKPMLDLSPDAGPDEARMLRLLAGFMAISIGGDS